MRMLAVLALLALPAAALAARTPPSKDPYTASLAYAKCMRAHGVPHPDPDRTGDFHLTPAQERRLKQVPYAKRQAADKACFYTISALDNRPLSVEAQRRALGVLRDVSLCMKGRGHLLGAPVVKNLGRGRAFFGFQRAGAGAGTPAYHRDELYCERHVRLAQKLDAIIAQDRSHL
jgi:hypothetical protein